MDGIAADHAAERDHAVIGLFLARRGIERHGDRGRDFERARHGDAVVARAGLVQRAGRARQQGVGDIVIKARLDNENARALTLLSLVTLRRAPAIGHSFAGTSLAHAAGTREPPQLAF